MFILAHLQIGKNLALEGLRHICEQDILHQFWCVGVTTDYEHQQSRNLVNIISIKVLLP